MQEESEPPLGPVKLIERRDLRDFLKSRENPVTDTALALIRDMTRRRDEFEWFEFGPGVSQITEYAGPYPLPYPRCAFSYQMNELLVCTYLLEQVDDKVLIASFSRLTDEAGPPKVAALFFLQPHDGLQNGIGMLYSLTEWDDDSVQHNLGEIGVLISLINQPGLLKRISMVPEATARKRARRGLPIPMKTIVDVNQYVTVIRPQQEARRESSGTGTPRSPHWRRAHYRRLRSGKVIVIRATAIHGGSERPRDTYVVPAQKES